MGKVSIPSGDDVDQHWNIALDAFEDSGYDDKESYVGDESNHGEGGTTCEFLDGDWPKLTTPSHGKLCYFEPKNASIMPCTYGMISQAANDMGGMPTNIVSATIQSQVIAMNPNIPSNLGIQVQN
jgi:hypothetical protein